MQICPRCGLDWNGKSCTNCGYGASKKEKKLRQQRVESLKAKAEDKKTVASAPQTYDDEVFSLIPENLFQACLYGIQAYLFSFPVIVFICFIHSVIAYAIVAALFSQMGPDLTDLLYAESGLAAFVTKETFIQTYIIGFMYLLWYVIINLFTTSTILYYLNQLHARDKIGGLNLMDMFKSMVSSLIGATNLVLPRLASAAIFNIGITLLVIPGLYLYPKIALVDYCALFADGNSIKNSWRYSDNNWFALFGIGLLFKFIPFMISYLLIYILPFVYFHFLASVISFPAALVSIIIFTISICIWHFTTVVFYYVYRCIEYRKELVYEA
jgi:ribosomal protein L37E